MLHEILEVPVDYARAGLPGRGHATLATYIRSPSPEMPHAPRPALVICPGGGYSFTSAREAEPIALRFLDKGFACFVLWYTVDGSVRFPGALLELASSVALVRRRAAEWNVDPDKIAVCGFSAGGHLAGSLGVLWDRAFLREALDMEPAAFRPNGMILSYPVVTSGPFAHQDSFRALLGDRYGEKDAMELVSLEKQVSAETAPAFLWHTGDDPGVPCENSLLLADALRRHGVPFELHILPSGPHGLSLAEEETGMIEASCQPWPDWAALWLRAL